VIKGKTPQAPGKKSYNSLRSLFQTYQNQHFVTGKEAVLLVEDEDSLDILTASVPEAISKSQIIIRKDPGE